MYLYDECFCNETWSRRLGQLSPFLRFRYRNSHTAKRLATTRRAEARSGMVRSSIRVHHPATAYNPAPGYVQHHANNQVPSAELMRRPEIQPQRTRRPPIDRAVLPPFNSLAFPRKRISRFQATMLLNNRMATTSRRRLTETVGLPRTVRTLSIGSDSSTLSPALIQVMVTALRPPATPPMPSKRRSRDNNQRSSQTCNRIRTFKTK